MASTKRSWRSDVHLKRCFPLPPAGAAAIFTADPPKTPAFASCSTPPWDLCGTMLAGENFFAWYVVILTTIYKKIESTAEFCKNNKIKSSNLIHPVGKNQFLLNFARTTKQNHQIWSTLFGNSTTILQLEPWCCGQNHALGRFL